jgi:hypothetical protein
VKPKSIGGAQYILTFTDDYSRKTEVYLLKEKSEVMRHFEDYKVRSERETGERIKKLRTDNGGEFTGEKFEKFLRSKGIKHEYTMPYTPEQNGVSERINRTLLERTRCMLRNAKLEDKFWGEAILTANYMKNKSPSKILGDLVPDEIWKRWKPTVNYTRIFGCEAYVLKPKVKRKGKLDERAQKMIFVGYASNRRGYRFWNPAEKKIVFSKDVRFMEDMIKGESEKKAINGRDRDSENVVVEEEVEIRITERPPNEDQEENQEVQSLSESPIPSDEESSNEEASSEEDEEEQEDTGDANSRILRERTPQIKPVKYTAFAWDEDGENVGGDLMSLYGPYPGAKYI